MKRVKNTIVICLLFSISMASAQENAAFWNNKMLEIAHKGEHIGWVDIKEEFNFSKNDFFEKNKEAYIPNENKLIKQKGGKK